MGRDSENAGGVDSRRSARGGFTLTELLAVLVILAILSAVVLPKFLDWETQSKVSACKGALGGVRTGISYFYSNEAVTAGAPVYPTLAQLTNGSSLQEAVPDNPYNQSHDVTTATLAEAGGRTVIVGGAGWAYYDGSGGGKAIFYANSNTIGENSY